MIPGIPRGAISPQALATLCLLTAWGCGGGSTDPFTRVPVTGTVQLDGQPVEFGSIALKGQKNEATQDVAEVVLGVRGGKFSSDGGALSTTAGSNEVTVTIYKKDPATIEPEETATAVTGYWKGQVEVQSGQAVTLDLNSAELKK